MTKIRDILNDIKWHGNRDIRNVEVWYLHRGAPNDTKVTSGKDIKSIGKSFLEIGDAYIPYHRITKIIYNGKIIFER